MPSITEPDEQAAEHATGHALKRNVLGAWGMAFLVIAIAAPLSASATGIALTIGLGNGTGAPGAFLLIALILIVFAVGFAAMSRYVTNAGAFYAYVGAALGYRMGAATGYVATLSYNLLCAFTFGISGFYGAQAINDTFGTSVPWWAVAFAFIVIAFAMGYFGTEIGARITGTLLVIECAFLLLIDGSILVNRGIGAFSFEVFSPGNVFSGSIGIALVSAFLSFIGFEATAIFGEEAKDPKRTVARATRIAIIVTGVLFVFTAWAVIANYGPEQAVDIATGPDAGSMFVTAITDNLGAFGNVAFSVLIVTSSIALVAANHGAASRYLFAMSRAQLGPRGLAKVHPRYRSPHIAQIVQALFCAILLAIWAVLGLDPFLHMGILGTLGAIGVVLLQTLVSLAVIVFFRRRRDRRVGTTLIAPIIAGLAQLTILVLAVAAWPTLIGFSLLPLQLVPFALVVMGLIGWVVASVRGPREGEFPLRSEQELRLQEERAA